MYMSRNQSPAFLSLDVEDDSDGDNVWGAGDDPESDGAWEDGEFEEEEDEGVSF